MTVYLPTVGALWIGGSLTWLEQLCLKSFVDKGHPTVLYTYGKVTGVPAGVEVADGRSILDVETFVTHERSESVALFSDLFRFHMIQKIPGIIWIDTDIYCHHPIDFEDEFLFGFEVEATPGQGRVNGAVLRLPAHSKTLSMMLEFMANPYTVPEWLETKHLPEIKARQAAGNPMHASEMPWGIWGPLGITAFLKMSGELEHTKSRDVFYPVHFVDRWVFYKRPMKTINQLTEDTRTVHLWAPIKKLAARDFEGLCPPGSYIAQLLAEHDIDAAAAPVPTAHKRAIVQ